MYYFDFDQYRTNECSPEGNRCRKSKVQYDTQKYPVYVLNVLEMVTMSKYNTHN